MSVDPLAGKYVKQTPYCYADCNPIMKNDPTGMGTEEGGGNNSDGGKSGGGKSTAGDKDGKGVDKIHGVETRIGDNGEIQAKVKGSWTNLKEVSNAKAREAIQKHWDGVKEKDAANLETKASAENKTETSKVEADKSIVNDEEIKKNEEVKKNNSTDIIKENGNGNPPSNLGNNNTTSNNKPKGDEKNEPLEAAKKIVKFGESVMQYSKEQIEKDITKDVKKHHPQKDLMKTEKFKNLIKTRQIIERIRVTLKRIGVIGDLYSVGERIMKMVEKGKVIIKEVVEAVGDFVTGAIEGLAGPLTIFASFAMDYIKESELYKSSMEVISKFITPFIKKIIDPKYVE